MSLNIFYLSPIHRNTHSIELNINENIDNLYEKISQKESISGNGFKFKLYSNGKPLKSTECLSNDCVIRLHFGLNGGKGGFGSMLRAIGAQIEKTTNREACRDLTGRRLRDINEEKRIKEWIKKEKNRKEESDERRRQKLEKMIEKPKIDFNDQQFEQNREEIPKIVDEALQFGLQQQQQQQQQQQTAQTSGQQKRKSETDSKLKKKKKLDLWVGEGIDISDSSDDSCDEPPETGSSASTSSVTSVVKTSEPKD